MAKPRYFISSDLNKLEDAYVCFRYWSCLASSGRAPSCSISVIKQKINKSLFATVNKEDYNFVFDPRTGKLIHRDKDNFNEALSYHLAGKQSAAWIEQKLGKDWYFMIEAFITRFARKHGILAAITKAPLITMALSKNDWKKVKDKCLNFEVVATEKAEKLVADGVKSLEGYTVEMGSQILDSDDKSGLANCIELIEVDSTGKPIQN